RLAAGEASGDAQLFLDAQKLVVLGDAVSAGGGSGLDLACAHGDDEIGQESVLGLAGAVRDNRSVTRLARHFDSFDGLAYATDLVQLDEDGVADAFRNAARENLRVGNENVVTHQLDFLTEIAREDFPAVPVVFG